MIIGNPDKFAIHFDEVLDWGINGASWTNGVFCFYINGKRVPEKIYNFELNTTLAGIDFSKSKISDFEAITNEKIIELANTNPKKFFIEGVLQYGNEYCKGVYPMDITELSDNGINLCLLFMGTKEVLLWTVDEYNSFENEIFLNHEITKSLINLTYFIQTHHSRSKS